MASENCRALCVAEVEGSMFSEFPTASNVIKTSELAWELTLVGEEGATFVGVLAREDCMFSADPTFLLVFKPSVLDDCMLSGILPISIVVPEDSVAEVSVVDAYTGPLGPL